MEMILLYLWLQITAFHVAAGATACAAVVAFGCSFAPARYNDPGPKKVRRWALPLFISSIVFLTLVPGKTDIAILVGASYALDLARSPEGQKVKTLILGKANELLDAEIEKLKPREAK